MKQNRTGSARRCDKFARRQKSKEGGRAFFAPAQKPLFRDGFASLFCHLTHLASGDCEIPVPVGIYPILGHTNLRNQVNRRSNCPILLGFSFYEANAGPNSAVAIVIIALFLSKESGFFLPRQETKI